MRWVAIGLILGHSAWCADVLSPNEPVRRSLEPNAIHEYSLPGSANTYLELEVDLQGARLEVEAGAIHRRLAGADMQPATLCWVSTDGAPTILRIRSLESKAVRPYGLRLVSRVASTADQARARGCGFQAEEKLQDALREFEAAGDWARQGEIFTRLGLALWDLGKTRESVAAHEKAVEAWSHAQDPGRKAGAMVWLGAGYILVNRREEGMKTLRAAASLAHDAADKAAEGVAVSNLARNIAQEGGYAEATAMSARAVQLKVEAGDRKGEADAQINWAAILQDAGFLNDALIHNRRSLALRVEIGDEVAQAQSLNNLATVYRQLGDPVEATAMFERALEIRKRIAGPQAVANTQHNLGVEFVYAGEFDRALGLFEQALTVWRSTKHKFGEAATLTESANVYLRLRLEDRAERAYRDSLAIQRELKNRRGESTALLGLGNVMRQTGRYNEAEQFLRSTLEVSRQGKFPQEEVRALDALGRTHSLMGRHNAAIAELREAVTMGSRTNRTDMVASENALGQAFAATAQTEKAIETFEQALLHAREIESRTEERTIRAGLARLLLAKGDLAAARSHALAAVEMAEDLRTKVASPDLRAQLLDKVSDTYRLAVEAFMRSGQTREAFSLAERGRARALLDLLATGAPSLAEERKLRTTLNAKADRLTRLLAHQAATSETEPLRREIAGLLDAHAALKERIAREDPRFSRESAPTSIEEIQEHIGPGEAVVEFSLGAQHSYLWVLKRGALDGFALPPRAKIEAAAARLRQSVETRDAGSADELNALLVGPANALSGVRRLYLVLDGELQYVPFASLAPLRNTEVVTLPSAAFLARLPARTQTTKKVAVFADPVYEISDARFRGAAESAGSEARTGLRASEASLRFPRLRFSEQEAAAIVGLSDPRGTLLATGFAATRKAALTAPLDRFGVVHFAAHGVLNEQEPELSGIVLSLYDSRGRPTDGFVRLNDVMQLHLHSQLVVLSACETAMGRRLDGEGIIGLSRAFLAAGASGVVATLWSVDDAATAHFMKAFYDGLLRRRMSPAAALHAAQVAVRSQEKWASPFYWAGFTYVGR